MSASTFTWTADRAKELKPQYNVVSTISESFKQTRQYYGGTTPLTTIELEFKVLDATDYGNILTHYNSAYGEYDSFVWNTVPSYINGGSNMTVHYAEFDPEPIEKSLFHLRIVFEKVT